MKRVYKGALIGFWALGLAAQEAPPPGDIRTLRPQQGARPRPDLRPLHSLIVVTDASVALKPGQTKAEAQAVALAKARQQALDKARGYLLARGGPLEGDLQDALAGALAAPLEAPEGTWQAVTYHAPTRWEVRLESQALASHGRRKPGDTGLLEASLWTSQPTYHQGEAIQIFLKGNRPFHARIVYRDAQGQLLQLLPNPSRTGSAFPGNGVVPVPGVGDRFRLTVAPPFGAEQITLFASSAPLGDLKLGSRGAVFEVHETPEAIARSARSARGVRVDDLASADVVEFVECRVDVITMP